MDKFVVWVGANSDPWERRLAEKFGIVLAGAILASEFGIAPWTEKRAANAIGAIYRLSRGALASGSEATDALIGILGITVRELDRLVEIFELSERFKGLRDPSAAITWARELMGVSKKLLTPSVIDAVVAKVGQKRITNSKDLRKLRAILPDPVARENFLSDEGDLETAGLRIAPEKKAKRGLSGELDSAVEAMRRVPWTALEEMRGDEELLKRIDEAQALLNSLRKTLSS
jgi:hypothetical protein